MRQNISINEPTKTPPPEVKLIQKRKNWCPINQCECLFEKCAACRTWKGIEVDDEDGTLPSILGFYGFEETDKPVFKVYYCDHYKKEIKRKKL